MSQGITTKGVLLLLPLSIFSFADPITDILTLIEYFSAGHKNWFAVGLFFILFPCFVFSIPCISTHNKLQSLNYGDDEEALAFIYLCGQCLCSINPFTAAFMRLEAFIFCARKKIWLGETISKGSREHTLLEMANLCAFFEVISESAPQFIIQLYVVNVQKEPVSIIQMISLPISFLTLVWTFKVKEQDCTTGISIKHKFVIFITHVLVLSARLFAITYFIVSFKWWIISVMFAHFIGVRILNCIWIGGGENEEDREDYGCCIMVFGAMINCFAWLFQFTMDWLGYEMVSWIIGKVNVNTETNTKRPKLIQLSFNIFIVLQNMFMILLYYFLTIQNTWYSLPVTVCVCSFSAVGAIIRLLHSNLFLNKHNAIQPEIV